MSSPAEIIKQLLVDQGLGDDIGSGATWPVFVSSFPDTPTAPKQAICVYDTAGKQDGRMMRTGERIEHPGIQIRLRGPTYSTVWAKANSIATTLDVMMWVLVALSSDDSYIVHNVSRTGAILPVGVEVQGNHRLHHFTMNAVMTVSAEDGQEALMTSYGVLFFVVKT